MSFPKNILITGLPGIGKTTLVQRLSKDLSPLHPIGFYTSEIREQGTRKGFALISLHEDRKAVLSHVDIRSADRVGKYGVDIPGFERFLDSVPFSDRNTRLIIIDEIGKMECLSRKFRELITHLLDSDKPLVATIALKGAGFIEEIKGRSDIRLFEISERNRDALLRDIAEYAGTLFSGQL